jgi:hypothetical protein
MTPQEAEKIIHAYSTVLGNGTEGGIARKHSTLPCSKSRIRFAYYVYLTYLTEQGDRYEELIHKLMVTYAALPQFVADREAEELNSVYARKRDKGDIEEDASRKLNAFQSKAFDPAQMTEIDAFVQECYFSNGRQN